MLPLPAAAAVRLQYNIFIVNIGFNQATSSKRLAASRNYKAW
jgi:hypothetical protein